MKVLDTSAVIRSDFDFSDGVYLITNGVLSEFSDDNIRELIGLAIGKRYIKVFTPSRKSLEAVKKKAVETGDLGSLSSADLEVLAAAYEKKAVIASDDYAIQNVASALNIKFEKTVQDGIKKKLKWENICVGCGRKYAVDFKGTCPVCGLKTKRKPAKEN